MKKDKFNEKFREYARTLSPQLDERDLISEIYQSFKDLLGVNNCIQIGSYPRFTAITPVHDLDILYVLGDWDENNHDPSTALRELNAKIDEDYEKPTDCEVEISLQTHSTTISYLKNSEEVFSVDIVPAYIFSTNELNEDIYKVPEIIRERHGKNRIEYYQRLSQEHKEIGWITSDPRGYIKIASEIDQLTNGEFRKTAKIIKKWKNNLIDADNNLKLKSFHLEQVITRFFQENQRLEIFDAIFKFFTDLPEILNNPNQINDRANNSKFIDDYLEQFTEEQKEKIKYARDGFLIKLENLKESDSIEELLEIVFYRRKPNEEFLFDSGIKVFIDDALIFKIDGFVKPLAGYSSGWLTQTPQLQKGLTRGPQKTRYIEFSIRNDNTSAEEYRWKVRNSDKCEEPRGEITLNQTKNNPERTAYIGDHYVECYAIKNGVCFARSKVPVRII
jgi:predicted nucleotidyltransferase